MIDLFPAVEDLHNTVLPLGGTNLRKPPTQDVERFLFMLRFDSRGKVNALGRFADPEADKKGM
jgi:hypothetical protein